MATIPVRSLPAAGLGVWLSLGLALAGCGPPGPAAPVEGLYRALIDSRVTGAPLVGQLATISPFISADLRALLDSARAIRAAEATAQPDEKPSFAEGDLFTSLFEGPTSFTLLPAVAVAGEHRVPVRFRDERPLPAVEWTDTVLVRAEGGRWVVADVVYGGTWDFANQGGLVASLRDALAAQAANSWVLELTGIGPAKVGMTIAQAQALLGAARIERIEPSDPCGYAYFASVPAGISFMVAGDTLVRTNVDTTGFRSGRGLGLGSREADVLSAYSGMVRVEPHPYLGPEGHYLIVEDSAQRGYRLIFETDGRVVTSFRAGRIPEVDLIEGCA